jgi:hypothetical protein
MSALFFSVSPCLRVRRSFRVELWVTGMGSTSSIHGVASLRERGFEEGGLNGYVLVPARNHHQRALYATTELIFPLTPHPHTRNKQTPLRITHMHQSCKRVAGDH